MSNRNNREINLLKNYPKSKRNVSESGQSKTKKQQELARKFGKDFVDGDRSNGYGGYYYNERFWKNVIPDFVKHYNLKGGDKILDVGCGKGFMLFDFYKYNPNFVLEGIDISEYAIDNAKPEIKNFVKTGNAKNLHYDDNFFDLVISITTVHNLDIDECKLALKEIERVSKKNKFITVDAYSNQEEKKMMYEWNLTAKTILHTDEWKKVFQDINYSGDYYWFKP